MFSALVILDFKAAHRDAAAPRDWAVRGWRTAPRRQLHWKLDSRNRWDRSVTRVPFAA
jgi:hypothetical protein